VDGEPLGERADPQVAGAGVDLVADGAQLRQIAQLVDDGVLRPVVERTYPFAEVPEALAHVAGGRSRGKIVVDVAGADR
jgi:NADPH:quinone reductase-like Zn-dependent oxidoreductase